MTEYQAHAAQLQAAEDRADQAQRARDAGFEAAPVADEAEMSDTAAWLLILAAALVAAAVAIALGLPVGVK